MKQTMRMTMSAAAVAVALTLSGCATDMQQAKSPAAQATAPLAKEFYVVLPENGRIYAFGDTKNYFDFLAHAEVALTRTQIGAGPDGKTVVYGITKDDVKKNTPSLAEQIFQDKLGAGDDFYGEVFKNGRYYVFGNLKDMKAFSAFGEVPYSYTDIGAGPTGETLVWVMNKDSYKKGKPTSTIDRFSKMRASKG